MLNSHKATKMPLSFSCFVFFFVHSYLLTVVAALPVTQTTVVITQTYETDSKETKTPVEGDVLRIGKADAQLPATKHKSSEEARQRSDEESKESFRPCRVANVTYEHREQVPRRDPCEMCVCVDAELYCLWKLCSFFNSTTSAPTPSPASSSKQSVNDNKTLQNILNETNVKVNEIEETNEKFSKMLKDQRKYNALKKLEATSPRTTERTTTTPTTTTKAVTSTSQPTVCYVMGVMYKYGEVLPRDTGTCLECSCSDGGRVTCSPKDCVSQPDLDYLSHNNNLDMFDLDTF